MDFHELDAVLAANIADGLPGVVAAVTVDGDTVFEGAAGVRAAGATDPMATDTVIAIYSMTKAITAAAAMLLVERGVLSLDEPVGRIEPDLADLQVLDGFTDDGTPRLRPARTPLTLRHLLTHTSGFVYDMWNGEHARYLAVSGTPSLATLQRAAVRVPLMFDPGSRWEYGIGIDWAGLVVEAATGTTLGRFLDAELFGPLGMRETTFAPSPELQARMASLHLSTPDGPVPFAMPAPEAPEFEMGGGGLVSTTADYLRFANMILNGGSLGGVRVLRADTVEQMSANAMGELTVQPLMSVNPMLTADADFFPGAPARWGLSFLINDEPTPEGRPAGSLAWAGLANSYHWIDRVNRVCGVWATQLFPFFAPTAIEGFRSFERATYAAIGASRS
jgi:CubicO group peptidase (beta-lactamase class C family)